MLWSGDNLPTQINCVLTLLKICTFVILLDVTRWRNVQIPDSSLVELPNKPINPLPLESLTLKVTIYNAQSLPHRYNLLAKTNRLNCYKLLWNSRFPCGSAEGTLRHLRWCLFLLFSLSCWQIRRMLVRSPCQEIFSASSLTPQGCLIQQKAIRAKGISLLPPALAQMPLSVKHLFPGQRSTKNWEQLWKLLHSPIGNPSILLWSEGERCLVWFFAIWLRNRAAEVWCYEPEGRMRSVRKMSIFTRFLWLLPRSLVFVAVHALAWQQRPVMRSKHPVNTETTRNEFTKQQPKTCNLIYETTYHRLTKKCNNSTVPLNQVIHSLFVISI